MVLSKLRVIQVPAGDVDYGAVSKDLPAYALLMSDDLKTGERTTIGLPRAADGRYAYGMGGAKVDRDGKLWFVGAFEEPDKSFQAGQIQGKYGYSLGLGMYDPAAAAKGGAR